MNYSGKLLIASPSLIDPNFRQTVVFLVQGSDDEEVFGLVLNRVSEQPLRAIWKPVFHQDFATDSLLYFGGPVFSRLTALHSIKLPNSFEVVPGVYFTSIPADLKQIVRDQNKNKHKNNHFRFFFGNAGWDPNQLLQEIAEGVWYLAEATQELVFNNDSELWQHLIEAIGQNILSEILHTNKFPNDPALN
jgi:putative transcriptional regulator